MKVKVSVNRLNAVKQAIEKLNRRARRLDLPEVTLTVGKAEVISVPVPKWHRDGYVMADADNRRNVQVVEIDVLGEMPRLAGWKFIASIQHTAEGNILKGFGEEIPVHYRTVVSECDHCQTKRSRKKTYLLLSDIDGYKQVGRTCLKDFMGATSSVQASLALAHDRSLGWGCG